MSDIPNSESRVEQSAVTNPSDPQDKIDEHEIPLSEDDARLREWTLESKKSHPGRKPRKFKPVRQGGPWLSLLLVLLILAVIGGVAYLDFTHTNYVFAPGPKQTFERYRTAVKEKHWADAYDFFSPNHCRTIAMYLTRSGAKGKDGRSLFVEQLDYVHELGGKDILFSDIDVVSEGTIDHYDEATDTIFLKPSAKYLGFYINIREGTLIEFRMAKTSRRLEDRFTKTTGRNGDWTTARAAAVVNLLIPHFPAAANRWAAAPSC